MAGVVTVIEPVVCPQAGWVTASTGVGGPGAAVMVACAVAVQVLLAVLLIVMVFAPTVTPLKTLEAWKVVPLMLYS